MKRRPKTGEPREVRQPLKIDRLPLETRDEILRLRNREGRTWAEIEELSQKFAGKRLPSTSLQRWYDLRWEQVQKETQARSERARVFAAAIAGKDFKQWPEAVKNFLGDTIFALAEGGQKADSKLIGALTEMGWLLQEYRKSDLKQEALALEKQKLDQVASKIRGLRQAVGGKRKLEPAELQKRLDEIYGLTN